MRQVKLSRQETYARISPIIMSRTSQEDMKMKIRFALLLRPTTSIFDTEIVDIPTCQMRDKLDLPSHVVADSLHKLFIDKHLNGSCPYHLEMRISDAYSR